MSGLQLPPQVGLGQGAQDAIHQDWDTYDRVMKQLASEGFQPIPPPRCNQPVYITAEQLTDRDSKQNVQLWSELISWQNYSEYCLACIDFAAVQTENEMDNIVLLFKNKVEAEAKAAKEKKPTEANMERSAKTDGRYMQLRLYLQMLQQKRLMVDTQVKRLSKNKQMLSRYVTIRGQDIEQDRQRTGAGSRADFR